MILITLVELYEIAAPTPNANNKVAVKLRVSLRLEQLIAVESVELQLMTSETDVRADKHSQLLDGLLIAEDAVIQLDGERTAIDGILEIWLRE